MLDKENLRHNVLNAKFHHKEAEIIAEAVPETFIEDQLETTAKSELDPRPQTVSLETPSLAEEPVKEIAADANDFSAERNTRNRSLAIAAAAVVLPMPISPGTKRSRPFSIALMPKAMASAQPSSSIAGS